MLYIGSQWLGQKQTGWNLVGQVCPKCQSWGVSGWSKSWWMPICAILKCAHECYFFTSFQNQLPKPLPSLALEMYQNTLEKSLKIPLVSYFLYFLLLRKSVPAHCRKMKKNKEPGLLWWSFHSVYKYQINMLCTWNWSKVISQFYLKKKKNPQGASFVLPT